MLHDARDVAEPQVDVLDFLVSDEIDKISGTSKGHFHSSLSAVQ
jgi:hypothetical protein